MIDLNTLAPWVAILIAAASLAYTIISGRSKKFDERFQRERERTAAHERDVATKLGTVVAEVELFKDRVIVLENDFSHLPDKDVTHRLEMALSRVEGEVGKLAQQVKPIAAMADRMQEALIEKVMS